MLILQTVFYARELEIAESEDPTRWKWIKVKIPPPGGVFPPLPSFKDAAELLKVYSLDVRKRVKADMLPYFDEYEAAFEVMMKEDAKGWKVPVTLELNLLESNEIPHITYQDMQELPIDQWVTIKVGKFKYSDLKSSDIEFSMTQNDDCPKNGMIVKALILYPIFR